MASSLMVLSAGMSGCFGQEYRDWGNGWGIDYENTSDRILKIGFESAWGRFNESFPPGGKGGASMGCDKAAPTWWLTIWIGAVNHPFDESYHWSDVGCGTSYEFVYRGPNDVSLTLVDQDSTVTKTGLPRE